MAQLMDRHALTAARSHAWSSLRPAMSPRSPRAPETQQGRGNPSFCFSGGPPERLHRVCVDFDGSRSRGFRARSFLG